MLYRPESSLETRQTALEFLEDRRGGPASVRGKRERTFGCARSFRIRIGRGAIARRFRPRFSLEERGRRDDGRREQEQQTNASADGNHAGRLNRVSSPRPRPAVPESLFTALNRPFLYPSPSLFRLSTRILVAYHFSPNARQLTNNARVCTLFGRAFLPPRLPSTPTTIFRAKARMYEQKTRYRAFFLLLLFSQKLAGYFG